MAGHGRRWTKPVATSATAALVAAAVLAVTAQGAGATITTTSKSLTINPGGTRSAAAACPAGTLPISAGFGIGGFSPAKGGIIPAASVRTAGRTSATGRNFSDSLTGTLTDYAYCDTEARTIVTRSAQVALPIDKPRTATAFCPAGTTPISGGYRIKNGPESTGAAYRSRKVAGGWQTAAFNGGTDPSAMTAFAYCERHGPQLQTRSATTTIPMQKQDSLNAICPTGTTPISGGFDGHLATSPSPRAAVPIASTRLAKGWRIKAFSASEGPNAKLTAFVYCESP